MTNDDLTIWSVRESLVRSWRRALAIVAFFVAAAVLITLLLPDVFAASARVLVSGTDDSELIETAVVEAQSDTIATQVMDEVDFDGELEDFYDAVEVSSVTVSVIEFSAKADSAERAEEIAQAMATAFVDYRRETATTNADVAVSSLESRQEDLQTQLESIDEELAALGLSPVREQALIGERDRVAAELTATSGALDTLRVQSAQDLQGTRIVLNASTPTEPVSPNMMINVFIGLVAGIGIALLYVMTSETSRGRVRRREEVANALGADVVGAATRVSRTQWADRIAGKLWPLEVKEFGGRLLEESLPNEIVVVSLNAGIETAALSILVAQLAADQGAESVLLPVAGTEDEVGKLLTEAGLVEGESDFRAYGLVLGRKEGETTWYSSGHEPLAPMPRPDLTISTTSFESRRPNTLPLGHLAGPRVWGYVVARSGQVDAAQITSAGDELRAAGVEVRGAILIDPDRFDRSSGRFNKHPQTIGS
jgi:capsular polysaccharide biosynthesis protein